MRVLSLSMENIGPFDKAELEFVADPEAEKAPVTLITGENGAGKSIILDAIRGMFGNQFCRLERPIHRDRAPFVVEMTVVYDGQTRTLKSTKSHGSPNPNLFQFVDSTLENVPHFVTQGQIKPGFVADFWRTTQATDSYDIQSFSKLNHLNCFMGALQGTYKNADVTNLICTFDYLRDSRDSRERQVGEALYAATSRIAELSLLRGGLSHVERATLTPIVSQSGQMVPLANVSSGNAYLIQHMISLLGRMYSVHVLRGTEPEDICLTPGLLLIDEAENHLHPRWQKRFIKNVLEIFPNLQIIATTHSPFIVASVEQARVYVCRFDGKTSVVEAETEAYVNKPIDEILVSAAFGGTQPFSEIITALLRERKEAVERGDASRRREIEAQLVERNPEYFSYFGVEERLEKIRRGAA